jgi:hypothetical protein
VEQRLKLGPLFAGASRAGTAIYQTDAEAIATNPNNAAYQQQTRKLDAAGMQEYGSQHLKIAGTADAILTVLAFGSPAEAASAVQALPDTGARNTDFIVPAVPGALGNDFLTSNGEVDGRNVYFHVGIFTYVLGFAPTSPPSAQQPSQETMATAAATWYGAVKQLG